MSQLRPQSAGMHAIDASASGMRSLCTWLRGHECALLISLVSGLQCWFQCTLPASVVYLKARLHVATVATENIFLPAWLACYSQGHSSAT